LGGFTGGSETSGRSRHRPAWQAARPAAEPAPDDRHRGRRRRRPGRAACARVLAAGPPPLSLAEIDHQRYAPTDLIDDLTHAVDAAERIAMTAVGWVAAGDAAPTIDFARAVLDRAGGPLFDGYRADGERPAGERPRST
jgi:hypothetical protein